MESISIIFFTPLNASHHSSKRRNVSTAAITDTAPVNVSEARGVESVAKNTTHVNAKIQW